MPENPLSPLSRALIDAFAQQFEADEIERRNQAGQNGLPDESTWAQIGDETRRQTVLNQRRLLEGIRPYNAELAAMLETLYKDGIPLVQHLSESPENALARLAAATFLVDYKTLTDYCSAMTTPEALRPLGTQAPGVEEFIHGLLDSTWGVYEHYGQLQNLFNHAGYIVDRDQALSAV